MRARLVPGHHLRVSMASSETRRIYAPSEHECGHISSTDAESDWRTRLLAVELASELRKAGV